jgi:hypothetical protein
VTATSSPAREKLLKSPPKKSSVLPAGGGGGNDFDTDYAEMERQQAEAWAAASPKGGSAATEPPEIASEGEVASAASKRYAKSMKRAEPRSASGGRAVFGTAGRFPGPRDEQGGKSAENRTLGAEVSSIQEVTGVDAWLSKRGPPSSSPVPEEEQQEPEPEPQPDTSSRGLGSARKKERYQPKPMERHPVEKKVFAATFNTVPRGDIWSQEKHARHGSVHQRSHEDEFHATYKPDRPGPGWSNVRWSAETSQMLGRGEPGRAQQRDLYGQTDEDKEAQRRRMEQAQREYEAQQRVRNTPAWETNKKWKTKIRPVPAPEEPKPPREPPTVQLEPQMAFGKREAGQSSPFLSKKREDLFHHHTSGSPRPGQLHTSDANVSLPLRGDDVTDSEAHSPGNSSFKAAVHAVEAANYMLDHQIQKFADDSQVVQVAKEKWKGTLAGREGNKSAKELKKALGYAPKDTGSNQQPSGANASVNRSTCKTKRIEDEKKVRAVRWVVGDSDECFDRTSNHHPEHYKRLLHGTSAHAQRRVAEALRHDMNPSKGSVVSKIINRHGKGARKNKQLGGSQERWWTRGEGYYDVRKRCGYVPAGFEGQGGAAAGFEAGASGHAHANGAGSSSRPVSSPASASPGPQSRRHVYTGAEAGDGEDAQSDGSWDSEAVSAT